MKVQQERAARKLVRVVDVASHRLFDVDALSTHHAVDLGHHEIRVVTKHRGRAHAIGQCLVGSECGVAYLRASAGGTIIPNDLFMRQSRWLCR